MSYKTTQRFSFDGKVFEEGQDFPYTDEDVINKMKERGHISGGKGTTADDVQAAARKEAAKKSAEGDKARAEEAKKREDEFIAQGGRPKASVRMKVDDQTEGIKEKDEKSGPNAPKK